MKRLLLETKKNVESDLLIGKSTREIAKLRGIGKSSVSLIRQSMCQSARLPKTGRPKKLSTRTQIRVTRLALSKGNSNAVEIKNYIKSSTGDIVSADTIRRCLKEHGMHSMIKKKKPQLSPNNIAKRLEFARRHLHWTSQDWMNTIFSDETKINRAGSNERCWVWKKNNDKSIESNDVIGNLKHGGGHIMMWGCITYQGVGYACKIDGNMDATLYTEILNGELIQTLEHYGLNKQDIVFQHDNDPKHTSNIARKWLKDNEISVLEWPAQSPDLNPIEHVWAYLKTKLAARENPPESIHELWEIVQKEWEAIPLNICQKLICSMPKRIAAVYKAKGKWTKY